MYRVEYAFGISEVCHPLVTTGAAPIPPRVWVVPLPDGAPAHIALVVRIPKTALRFPIGAPGVLACGRIRVRDGRGHVVRLHPFDVPPPRTEPCAVPGSGTWRE